MKKYILLFIILLFPSLFVVAQTDTLVRHDVKFVAEQQSLWGEGEAGLLDLNIPFFDKSWDKRSSFGDIASLAGLKFGFEMSAATWGRVGAGLTIEFGNEKVDVNYPGEIQLSMPSSGNFEKGEEVTIETEFIPNSPDGDGDGSFLDSTKTFINAGEYDPFIEIWSNFKFGFELGGTVCFFSCFNINIIPHFEVNISLDLIHVDRNGISICSGEINDVNIPGINFGSEYIPFERDVIDGISVYFDFPNNKSHKSYLNGTTLYSQSDPYKYAEVDFNIFQFIGGLKIPYVSAVLSFFEQELSIGPLTVGYVLIKMGFKIGLYHNQTLTFTPKMKAKFDFPTEIDYKVLKNSNVIANSSGSTVLMDVGNKLVFTYPCNYDFMDIDPYYTLEGNFRNKTYDSIAFDFYFQMIDLYIEMEATEVIPEICIPIYKPCGPWYCYICDWCFVKNLCTPAVVFPGIDWHLGPLVNLTPNIANVKYNWLNNNWTMRGFADIDKPAFRLRPAKYFVKTTDVFDVNCHGENTGSATAVVSHGKPPYVYDWSNGEEYTTSSNTNTVTNLGAGTHYVIVTDANKCVSFTEFVISQPESPLGITPTINNVDCHGNSTASILIETNGGTPNYNYVWSNGSTNKDLIDLPVGNYSLSVTDNNSCIVSQSFEITQPDLLEANYVSSNVLCYGESSGSASFSVSGGTLPYNYIWANGETDQNIDSLSAGTYSLTITDANLCSLTHDYEITQPTQALSVDVLSNDALCNGDSSGFINMIANGGTAPYSYSWYQDELIFNNTSSSLTNLPANIYRGMIEDANGCKIDTNVLISEPEVLDWTVNIIDNLCYGDSYGEIHLNVFGGTPEYNYVWSNGSVGSDIQNLAAGVYNVVITDNNNCVKQTSFEVSQPAAPLLVSIESTDVKCFGHETGSTIVNVSGGTPLYNYLWSNGSTTQNLTNVAAGTYQLTVTDDHSCVVLGGTVISQPDDSLKVNITANDVSCYNSEDGSIIIDANGGTTPYYLRWDDSEYLLQNAAHYLTKLPIGSYRIIVSDANNCESENIVNINQPDSILIYENIVDVNCFGAANGSIDISVAGGTTPYNYNWSNGDNSEDVTSLTSGYYYITITDDHGCDNYKEFFVGSASEIKADAIVTPISCKDNYDGKIVVSVSGGLGDYSYLWSNNLTSAAIDNLASGTYILTVSDVNSCEKTFEYIVESSTNECVFIPSSFTPNGDGTNDTWVIRNIDLYEGNQVQIFNRWGNLLYEGSPYTTPWDGKYNGNPVPAETYYYVVNLNNGQEPFTGTVTIIR